MDATLATVIVVAVLALIAIVAFLRYRKSSKVTIIGPFGTKIDVDASNDQARPRLSQADIAVDDSNVKAKGNISARNVSDATNSSMYSDQKSGVRINKSTVDVGSSIISENIQQPSGNYQHKK